MAGPNLLADKFLSPFFFGGGEGWMDVRKISLKNTCLPPTNMKHRV